MPDILPEVNIILKQSNKDDISKAIQKVQQMQKTLLQMVSTLKGKDIAATTAAPDCQGCGPQL